MNKTSLGIFLIFLGTLLWALDTLIRYPLLNQISSFQIVFLEHFYLTFYFFGFVLFQNFAQKINRAAILKQLNQKDLLSFFVIGAIGSGLSTLAFTKAFQLINPTVVILLQKLQPFLVIFFSVVLLKEKLEKKFFLWALIAFFGALLLAFDDLKQIQFQYFLKSENLILGYALTLFAVLGWSLSTIFGKRLSNRGYSESIIMSGRFSFGFLILVFILLGLMLVGDWSNYFSFSLFGQRIIQYKIIGMVVLSGLAGMYFYYSGLKKISAHVGSIAELFFPFSVIIINWVFLDQKLSMGQIIGAILMILASVGLAKKWTFASK